MNAEARRAVEAQAKALGAGAELWLAEGLWFGARPACPFCKQPTLPYSGMILITVLELLSLRVIDPMGRRTS